MGAKYWAAGIFIVVIVAATLLLTSPTGHITKGQVIKIGVIAPLTGPVADIGQYMREGLEMALEEINQRGGINGRKIGLLFEDTKVDPKLSVDAARKFIEMDGVKVIIGDYRSPNTLAVAPIAEENRVILISPGSQSDKISGAGDYIFRTQASVDVETRELAQFIGEELGINRVSLIVLNHDYGISFEEDFGKYYQGYGGKIDDTHRVGSEEKDFRTILLKVKSRASPVVVLAVGGNGGGLIANQAKELGLENRFVATSIIQTDDLLEVGGDSVEGWVYSYPYQEGGNPAEEDFSRKYREIYGKENEVIAANSYDALMLISQAIGTCREETACIRDWLYSIKGYQGASGTLAFDENGDVIKPIALKTVRNGEFVPYEA